MAKPTDRDDKYAVTSYWDWCRVGIDCWGWAAMGLLVRAVKLYPPKVEGGDWTGIVSAEVEGVRSVAFVSSPRVEDVIRLVAAGLLNGSLKWRVDRYAE